MQATEQAVDRRMHTYIDAMLDGRGLFAASRSVTREGWSSYVACSELERRYPGIQAIAYAERVPLEERGAYARRVRDEGFPSFELRPAGERYEYFPLTYVAPFEGSNRPLFGYDLYSDWVNRDAMEQARDTGLPRASGKVDLEKTGASWEASFVVYTPIYRDGAPQGTTDERRQALQGCIVSVFRPDELLAGIFGLQVDPKVDPKVDFEVFDGAEFTKESLLHDDDGVLHAADPSHEPHFDDIATLEVAGRIWSLYFQRPGRTPRGKPRGRRRAGPIHLTRLPARNRKPSRPRAPGVERQVAAVGLYYATAQVEADPVRLPAGPASPKLLEDALRVVGVLAVTPIDHLYADAPWGVGGDRPQLDRRLRVSTWLRWRGGS